MVWLSQNQLLGQVRRYWVISLIRFKVTSIPQDDVDYESYSKSKIIRDRLYFQVFSLKIAGDVWKYIQNSLLCEKWATIVQSVPLTLIQTRKTYKLVEITIVGIFERSAYGYSYILLLMPVQTM